MNDFKTTFVVKKIVFVNKVKEGNFVLAPELGAAFNKLGDNKWETLINFRVLDKEEQPFPFDLDIVVALITEFPKKMPNDFDLKTYLKIDSIKVLFPYVRSIVTNITSSALVTPIFIPLVDVSHFAENVKIPELEK